MIAEKESSTLAKRIFRESCVKQNIVGQKPTVGFGDASAQLNFDATYIEKVQRSKAELEE